jgi:hypothetical protein
MNDLSVLEFHEGNDPDGRILAELYTAPDTKRVTVRLYAGALPGESGHEAIVQAATDELRDRGVCSEDVDWIQPRP